MPASSSAMPRRDDTPVDPSVDASVDASVDVSVNSDSPLHERVRRLHGDVHESLESQFGATVDDLHQLRRLLGDATTKLSQAFQLMVNRSRDEGAIAARLLAEHDTPASREMHALTTEISRGATLVVQSLQFEDMASQLLQHVDRRVAWLEAFARDASLLRTAVQGESVGMSSDEFQVVEDRIAELRTNVGQWDRKIVQQQSLDEGDIELF